MHIFIKNMVCPRCVLVVTNIFKEAGADPVAVSLGNVELASPPDGRQMEEINARLEAVGFEILNDARKKAVEEIKKIIIRTIRGEDSSRHRNLSDILSAALNKDYSSLSKLFSEAEGITLEKYFIDQKTEFVKELLAYGELTLSEIAYELGYSSVAHLSGQFKKTTGITPSEFRKQHYHDRKPLDNVARNSNTV